MKPKFKKGDAVFYFDEEFLIEEILEREHGEADYIISTEGCIHVVQESELDD